MSFQCSECTLTRPGSGPICDECLGNMGLGHGHVFGESEFCQNGCGNTRRGVVSGVFPAYCTAVITQEDRIDQKADIARSLVELHRSFQVYPKWLTFTWSDAPPDKIAVDNSLKVTLR